MEKKALFACIVAVLLLSPGCAYNGFGSAQRKPSCKKCTQSTTCSQENACLKESFVYQDSCEPMKVTHNPVVHISKPSINSQEKIKAGSDSKIFSLVQALRLKNKQSSKKVSVQSASHEKTNPETKIIVETQSFTEQDGPTDVGIISRNRKEFNVMRKVTPPRSSVTDKKRDSKFELAVQKKKLHYLLNQLKNSIEFNERNVHELVVLLYVELDIIEQMLNKRKKKLVDLLVEKNRILRYMPAMIKRIYQSAIHVAELVAEKKKNRKQEYLDAMSDALVDIYSSIRLIEEDLAEANQRLTPDYEVQRKDVLGAKGLLEEFFPLHVPQGQSVQKTAMTHHPMKLPFVPMQHVQMIRYASGHTVPLYNQMSMMPVGTVQPVQYIQLPMVYHQQPAHYVYQSPHSVINPAQTNDPVVSQ